MNSSDVHDIQYLQAAWQHLTISIETVTIGISNAVVKSARF